MNCLNLRIQFLTSYRFDFYCEGLKQQHQTFTIFFIQETIFSLSCSFDKPNFPKYVNHFDSCGSSSTNFSLVTALISRLKLSNNSSISHQEILIKNFFLYVGGKFDSPNFPNYVNFFDLCRSSNSKFSLATALISSLKILINNIKSLPKFLIRNVYFCTVGGFFDGPKVPENVKCIDFCLIFKPKFLSSYMFAFFCEEINGQLKFSETLCHLKINFCVLWVWFLLVRRFQKTLTFWIQLHLKTQISD